MKTGRFINTLTNNVLAFYQTDKCEELLNKENLITVWNMKQSGFSIFDDELAIANTIITPEFDDAGRMILANDTVIVRFAPEELLHLLLSVMDGQDYRKLIETYQQNNGGALCNPLPEVVL
jgi:hypothetical protein